MIEKCEFHEDIAKDIQHIRDTKAEDSCLKKYIKKPSLTLILAIITIICIPLYSTSIKVWLGSETASYVYAKNETVTPIISDVNLLKSNVARIQSDLLDIKILQKENKEDMKEQLDEIKALVNQLLIRPSPKVTDDK
jgi:hypothetical protein